MSKIVPAYPAAPIPAPLPVQSQGTPLAGGSSGPGGPSGNGGPPGGGYPGGGYGGPPGGYSGKAPLNQAPMTYSIPQRFARRIADVPKSQHEFYESLQTMLGNVGHNSHTFVGPDDRFETKAPCL